jgi:hypothetical protein
MSEQKKCLRDEHKAAIQAVLVGMSYRNYKKSTR